MKSKLTSLYDINILSSTEKDDEINIVISIEGILLDEIANFSKFN